MDAAERVARGLVAAQRSRCDAFEQAEILEIDGLVLALSNVADPALNSAVVEREPRDPRGALERAEAAFAARGLSLGIELQAGRHVGVDEAVRALDLVRVIERPAMVAHPRRLPVATAPAGVEIRRVVSASDAEGSVQVGVEAFDDDPAVAGAFYGAVAMSPSPNVRALVAWEGAEPVGIASAYADGATVGIMGVGVVPAAERRGLGSALTITAATAFPGADLAWLHPSHVALSLYERLGFSPVSDWEVWTRRPGGDAQPGD
jgi:GNAT superfamily N-acetyltransferase